ncbi:MAG: glycosyltransferase family 2 protein [Leptolyngbyaceae cyanobacterium]
MPTVSVVIPLYNSERTIGRAIKSVLEQTFSDFELIVIDDGSTDSSVNIVKTFKDDRLRIFLFDNSGAPTARNRGIEKAKADLVAFLDSDDMWTPEKLADQVPIITNTPQAGLVYSWSDYIDTQDNVVCPGKRVTASKELEKNYASLLVSNFLENGSTPLIKKAVLHEVGGFDVLLKSSQDLDLYLKIAAKYQFLTIPKVQVKYRITPGSITSKIASNEQKEIEFIEQLFLKVPQKFKHLKRQKLSNLYRYLMLRTVEEGSSSVRGLIYLSKMLYYRPILVFEQWRFITVMILKALIGFLPDILSKAILKKPNQYPSSASAD